MLMIHLYTPLFTLLAKEAKLLLLWIRTLNKAIIIGSCWPQELILDFTCVVQLLESGLIGGIQDSLGIVLGHSAVAETSQVVSGGFEPNINDSALNARLAH